MPKRLLISIAIATAFCFTANAQKVIKHLSVGADLGTTGVGINLSLPVYKDRLVVKVAATVPNVSKSYSTDFNISLLSDHLNKYINNANSYLSEVHGESAKLVHMPSSTKLRAMGKLSFSTFRAVLEYYPIRNSGFHLSAGFYLGSRMLASADAVASNLWNVYSTDVEIVKAMHEKYPDFKEIIGKIPDLSANIAGKTYKVTAPGNVNLSISASPFRPYFGIGFGRSIPDSRVDVVFDLGGMYLLDNGFISTNEVPYQKNVDLTVKGSALTDIMNFLNSFSVYPVLNLGIVVRIF